MLNSWYQYKNKDDSKQIIEQSIAKKYNWLGYWKK